MRRYLRYLKLERGYSPNTIDAYQHDIGWLTRYLNEHHLEALSVTLDDLQLFAGSLREHGLSAKSQARIWPACGRSITIWNSTVTWRSTPLNCLSRLTCHSICRNT